VENVKDIEARLKKVEEKINCSEDTLLRIDTLESEEHREYFHCIYRMLIDHITAYRVVGTGFVVQDNRSFNKAEQAMTFALKAQPLLEMIPFVGQFVALPCQFMSQYVIAKTERVNSKIAEKIGACRQVGEEDFKRLISGAIQYLVERKEFRDVLNNALKKEQGSLFNKFFDMASTLWDKVTTVALGGTVSNYSYVAEAVLVHMTVITNKFYSMSEDEFKDAASDGKKFGELLLQAITPKGTKIQKYEFFYLEGKRSLRRVTSQRIACIEAIGCRKRVKLCRV
jgi:hypothetical protein